LKERAPAMAEELEESLWKETSLASRLKGPIEMPPEETLSRPY
jgi:hypothetical protein